MKNVLLYIFIFFGFALYGQQQKYIDSLEKNITKASTSLIKARSINLLSKAYVSIDLEKAKTYAIQGIKLSKANNYIEESGNCYNTMGAINAFLGSNSEALLYFDSAAASFKTINNKKGLISAYNNLGAAYYTRSDYKKALEYYYKTLQLSETLGDKSGIADALTNILGVNFVLEDYTTAIKNGYRAHVLFIELKDKQSQAFICHTLASVFEKKMQSDSAKKYISISLNLYRLLNNKDGIADNYVLLGYLKKDSAVAYLNLAIDLYEQTGNLYKKANTLQGLSYTCFENKDYTGSLKFCELLLNTARAINSKALERDALELLMKNYTIKKMPEKALFYATKLIPLKDSILNENNIKQIAELNTKYQTEKKEKENILLKQQNAIKDLELSRKRYLIYLAIIISFLVFVASVLIIRQQRSLAAQKNSELKQRLLRIQMNPHFIFNSLVAIQSFIYKSEPKEAGKYLSSFAKLVRLILENSTQEYIPLSKEINWLENYLQLQLLRFENKFSYKIEVDNAIDALSTLIPPMLTQPFIENALEHGINNLGYKGELLVVFKVHNKNLMIEVKDNGIGFYTPTQKKDKAHVSLALSITKERLLFLNKDKSNKIIFNIAAEELKGTHILFEIPLQKI